MNYFDYQLFSFENACTATESLLYQPGPCMVGNPAQIEDPKAEAAMDHF
jgi:hypothetical protein